MRRHFVAGMVGGVLMLLLAGVTGAVVAWAGEAKAVPSASPGTTTVSPAAAPAAYVYNSAGKPDPFRPFIEMELALRKKKQEEQLKKSLKEKPVSPLQQADIWKFRLVGIAGHRKKETASAIVDDGTKKRYYPLFVGTYIGLNGGRVAAILPDRVIVEEPAGPPPKKGKKAPIRRIDMMLHRD